MSLTGDDQFDSYLAILESRIQNKRIGESSDGAEINTVSPREVAFTEVVLDTLEDLCQLPDLDGVYLDKKFGRSSAKVNAFGVSEIDSRLDLVVTVHKNELEEELQKVSARDIESAVKQALHVYSTAKAPVFETMEPSSAAHDMMEHIHRSVDDIKLIRVVVLVWGLAKNTPEYQNSDGFPDVQLDVWDLERLFRADASGLTYESFSIDFQEVMGEPLPCLAASESSDDHQCYLALFPGDLLYQLYHRYGSRLLELNVRSFLQARGKVNRGIRDTLLNNPEYFLAYNNGISITVEELELAHSSNGSIAIKNVRGLQVVNGGQTVASIHRAKHRDRVDLSDVLVQGKITVVEKEHLDSLVPFISRFSNTQNKVNETDFSSNHPFHVRIQKLSEAVWAPGEVSRWFYERARGQWEVARAREGTTPARLRSFDSKLPRKQKVDKTLLAKAINSWNELPHVVSAGGQKNFGRFMKDLSELPENWEPDERYYKDMIAKVIIFKNAEKLARQIAFSAYRANAVCYTISLLAYRTAGRVDLAGIWSHQEVSENLLSTMREWMPIVHECIVATAGDLNVTEWCKKKECWSQVQSLDLGFAPGFESELAEGLPLPTVGKFKYAGNTPQLTAEERDRQARTMRYDSEEWLKMIAWGKNEGILDDFQIKLAGTVLGYAAGGWTQIPSPKQTKYTNKIIDLWEDHQRNTVSVED